MSSLAVQLAQSASLNSALLVDRSRRKPGESYLFTGREADQHDLESIYALGVNGLLQLVTLDSGLRSYQETLFSDEAKATDRTLLSADANGQLNKTIATFLSMLGPYLMEAPTGKVLEWLVRRFRINEFNVEAILSLFLPYHESPHFAKMVTILHIKKNTTWSFLLAHKAAAQNVPRVSLVTEMLRNSDIARFVTSLLPTAIKEGHVHRVLLAFNAATLHDFILRSRKLDEGTVAYLLPALLEPLQKTSKPPMKDAILGTYILLASLSQKCHISSTALKAVVRAVTNSASHVSTKHYINTILAVCAPQDEIDYFSDSTVKSFLRLSDIEGEIQDASSWMGVEKIIVPLLTGLGKRLSDSEASSLLEAIIAAPNIPTIVVERITNMLITFAISDETSVPAKSTAQRLLSNIQQRHPSSLSKVSDDLCIQNDTIRGTIEQLIISLSMVNGSTPVEPHSKESVDLIFASTNAETKVRIAAVKDLISLLSGQQTASDLQSIHSALVARVQDTNTEVLDALYEKPDVIIPILSMDSQGYIEYLSSSLAAPGSKPKRAVLKIHLTFLAVHFCKTADSSTLGEIFHQIFFPFLLFSKPRQHTADLVWDIVTQYLQGSKSSDLGTYELLAGCATAVKLEREKDDTDPSDKMIRMNGIIASTIARNILASNMYSTHFDILITKLQDPNAHIRVLTYLITRSLLTQLSGEHQIEAADRIMKVIAVEHSSSLEDLLQGNENFAESLDDKSLGKHIIHKPSSKNTSQWLQISIVALVPTIPPPSDLVLDWLIDLPSPVWNYGGHRYVGLMRAVYRVANISQHMAAKLLQTLFVNLKDDTLAFLAGIWATADEDDRLRVVALRHAAAFLAAHLNETDSIDFQTILPSLLVVLQHPNVEIRQSTIGCISLLRQLADQKFSAVYRFDAIYGFSERQLQYLGQEDFKKYLSALVEHQDHFMHDPTYIKAFHQQHLASIKSDKKRDSDYKRRVLCYLLSHINTLCLPAAQIALLKSIETISDRTKAQILLPSVQSLVAEPSISQMSEIYNNSLEEFTTLIISSFDLSTATDLNDQKGASWDVFLLSLRSYFKQDAMVSPRVTLTRALEHGLFSALKTERQVAICDLLLELGAQDTDAHIYCKSLLANIMQDVPLIIHLLNSLQPTQSGASPRASKRAKLSDIPDDTLPRLSLLVEVLGSISLPGSFDLISHLLETLNKVVQSGPTQADVSFIEQLLMSAVENAAEKIVEIPNLAPSAIRLDILVELIRVAENPQTFHQALLLMASLARLAPDSVLHNVMPVFTFMGSNVFHRDDTYSFRVVQQTIDSIVPVMVSSLKRTHTQTLDLFIGSKDFLRVFTDAANHVPRHRRTNFFAHLVDVLGPDDFLAPVCMLLVEKVVNRVIRQTSEEVQNSLALPTSILQHYSPALQIDVLTELLRESQRLSGRILQPDTSQRTFLEGSADTEHSMPLSAVLRRRAQALTIFVGHALKSNTSPTLAGPSSGKEAINDLVSTLIALSTLQEGTSPDTKVDDISQAARSTMSRALSVMSAVDFVTAALSMIESDNSVVQTGALDLLSERLGHISDNIRKEITSSINSIVGSIQKLVTSKTEGPLELSAFRALKAISLTLCQGEESVLTAIVPLILNNIKARFMVAPGLASLSPLSVKLGPRVIPYFREIVTQSINILREGNEATMDDAFGVIQGLLSSIPTFWGTAELVQVINLYVDHCAATSGKPSTSMTSLMKSIAKRAPTKTLLTALIELWSSLKASPDMDRTIGYFDLFTRALRSATRPAVLEQLRPMFKVFQESFDKSLILSTKSSEAEARAIAAFKELVIKLNDAAFRPLFRRLYDWAFAGDTVDVAKRITFCHMYIALLDFFGNLMNPYMTFLLQPFVGNLKSISKSGIDNQAFWMCIIEIVTKSLNFDDGAFWRDDKLRQIASPLIQQVPVCVKLNNAEGKSLLQECLKALTDCATDDDLLKSVNLDLLMHTRSEDSRLRLFALTCSESLWQAHGGKLLGFVAETSTFIAECSEDENDMVVKESIKLKNAVESVAGNINGI